jgi:predicted RNA methylase
MPAKEGNKRVTGKEQYYTPKEIAHELVVDVMDTVKDNSGTFLLEVGNPLWVEPAGGTGSFVDVVEKFGYEVWSCDIEPKHKDVLLGDFLNTDLSEFESRNIIVYGNPPFGRNNSLSVKFFNKSAEVAEYIAFIVPRSWRKWSIQDRLDMRFNLVFDKDLDMNYVTDDGTLIKGSGLRTCFQIWKRSTLLRTPVVVEDRGYIKKCGPEEADASMTIFGRGCGTVKTKFNRVSNSTQMFIQAEDYVIKALSVIDFSEYYNRTAYIEALSIKEIWLSLNEYFDK